MSENSVVIDGKYIAENGLMYEAVLTGLEDMAKLRHGGMCHACSFDQGPIVNGYPEDCAKIGDFCITQNGHAVHFKLAQV